MASTPPTWLDVSKTKTLHEHCTVFYIERAIHPYQKKKKKKKIPSGPFSQSRSHNILCTYIGIVIRITLIKMYMYIP